MMSGSCFAAYRPIVNATTGKPDYVTFIDSDSIQGGSGVTVTNISTGGVILSASGSGGVSLASSNTWTGSQTFLSSFTILAPTPANYMNMKVSNTVGQIEYFQSGVKDHTLLFSGNNATFNDNIVTSGNSSVTGSFTLNNILSTVDTGSSLGNTGAGILEMWSASGSPTFISFNEHLVANRGALGYLAGSSTLIYRPSVGVIGSGTTKLLIDTSGNEVIQGSMTATAVVASTFTYIGSTFASLGATAINGTFLYCSDCTVTTPATCLGALSASCVCANTGTGALAKRLNSLWYCN